MYKYYLLTSVLLKSCTGIPEGVKPVDGFDAKRFQGTWYQIARLDHRFERGLQKISATYTPRADGGINVVNKGWNQEKHRWKEGDAKPYFINQLSQGRLKDSFFGPLYGGYNIIDLDKKIKPIPISSPIVPPSAGEGQSEGIKIKAFWDG
ncbi:MAG: hypothetical protein HOP23_12190 [Methylococcaceae bacterium]|nr:hypothetical protein [Methylococcaceae bacterium]